jgi:hypothetical protein
MKIGTLCWRAVSKQAQSKLFKNTITGKFLQKAIKNLFVKNGVLTQSLFRLTQPESNPTIKKLQKGNK